MKRHLRASLSLILVFGLFALVTGCQSRPAPSTPEQLPPSTETEPEEEPNAPPNEVQPPEQPEEPSPTDPIPDTATPSESADSAQEALIAQLEEIRQNIQVGTAGSSLAAARQAASLLDWGMEMSINEEQLRAVAQEWYGALDRDNQEEFQMQLSEVAGAVDQVTGEHGADLLDTAGCSENGYPWNESAKAAVQAILNALTEEA